MGYKLVLQFRACDITPSIHPHTNRLLNAINLGSNLYPLLAIAAWLLLTFALCFLCPQLQVNTKIRYVQELHVHVVLPIIFYFVQALAICETLDLFFAKHRNQPSAYKYIHVHVCICIHMLLHPGEFHAIIWKCGNSHTTSKVLFICMYTHTYVRKP